MGVDIVARERRDMDGLADRAVEAVWRSTLDPVFAVVATVTRPNDPEASIIRTASFRRQEEELTRKYGPRP